MHGETASMEQHKRNENVNTSGESSIDHKTMKVEVSLRNVNGNGWKRRNMQASILGDLKTKVVEVLQPSWNDFALDSSHIRVFRKDGSELEPLPDNPETPLSTDDVYFAVEYFQTVPTDMYRFVRIDQLKPCSYSHPDHLQEEDRRWTIVSPLYCAAMKGNELQFPWNGGVSNQGNLDAHGVSLYCKDKATDSSDVNPFRAIEENEKVGFTRLALEKYEALLFSEGADKHPIFGSLETSVSHQMVDESVSEPKPRIKIENYQIRKDRKAKGWATERLVCFRYKIRRGTDLAPYGMALVYDNSSKHHCTLIRENRLKDEQMWVNTSGLLLPRNAFLELELGNNSSSDERDTILRERAFRPFEPHREPETTGDIIAGKTFIAFPKVAALFVLHDISMQASAEPVPPETFDDPSQSSMYWAALVLYHVDPDDDVRVAIGELEAAAYHLSGVDSPHHLTLLRAMKEAFTRDDLIEIELDKLDEEGTMDPYDSLADGLGLLQGFLRATVPANTPTPVVRHDQANESPESTSTQATSSSSELSAVAAEPLDSEVTKSRSSDTNSSDVSGNTV
jgi:hypothetical protein